jgi:predicted neutral ceramidase superfamily lipid hydrolase
LFSIGLGLFVTIMAVVFVNSQFGIFNLMQAFFTLLNIPVVVPTAFGLIFRRVPKWGAVASIAWGLIVGFMAKFVCGWDIGPQVYLEFVFSFGIFVSSFWLARIYRTKKPILALISLGVTVLAAVLFTNTIISDPLGMSSQLQGYVIYLCAALLGLSLYGFAKLFDSDTDEDKRVVAEFFKKIDTAVDVAKEVFGAGRKQISTFPLVGGTTIVMGLLMSLIFITDITGGEAIILGVMITIMILFGAAMWYFGKKSEIRSAEQYTEKVHKTT